MVGREKGTEVALLWVHLLGWGWRRDWGTEWMEREGRQWGYELALKRCFFCIISSLSMNYVQKDSLSVFLWRFQVARPS